MQYDIEASITSHHEDHLTSGEIVCQFSGMGNPEMSEQEIINWVFTDHNHNLDS